MPEKRQGQDILNIYVPSQLKENFKRICQAKGVSMTEEITQFMEQIVEENQDLLKYLEERFGT